MHQIARFAEHSTKDGVRDKGSFGLALVSGAMAAILGALLWTEFTAVTGHHVGYLAIPVGIMVGLLVRILGGGSSWFFGAIGILFTLVGSLAGQYSSVIFTSTTKDFDYYAILTRIDSTALWLNIMENATALTYGSYAVAIVIAYLLSVNKVDKPL